MIPELAELLKRHGISPEFSEQILRTDASADSRPPVIADIPPIDGKKVFALSAALSFSSEKDKVFSRLESLGLDAEKSLRFLKACGFSGLDARSRMVNADSGALTRFGTLMFPLVSFGILNGGAASSYYDETRNRAAAPGLYRDSEELIQSYKQKWAALPKGLNPALVNPDGTGGPSYLVLKLRALLRDIERYRTLARDTGLNLPWDGIERNAPVFQMVSRASEVPIQDALEQYKDDPLLAPLIKNTGVDITGIKTGVQELSAAYTIPDAQGRREIFLYGPNGDRPLALPGGHGQNFQVLAPIYRDLHAAGKRFVYLGNIDNLAFLPDAPSLALNFLSDADASFEFSLKTPMDQKGGILVRTVEGRLTCADIGQSVDRSFVEESEKAGKAILFNCATGLFDLSRLVASLPDLGRRLPVRFSSQDKDVGRYSQGEQNTWEIIGLLERPVIFAVEKSRRFLAAKLFIDCLLTSGYFNGRKGQNEAETALLENAAVMHRGQNAVLTGRCGLRQENGAWVPSA